MSRSDAVSALAVLLPEVVDDACQLVDDAGLEKLRLVAQEVARCESLTISVADKREAVSAVEVLASASAAIKEAEAMQTRYCDPIYRQWKDARAIFAVPIERLKAFDSRMRQALNAFNAAERARQDAERRRLQREHEEAALAEAKARAALEEAETAEARKIAEKAAAEAIEAQRRAVVDAPRETKGVKTQSATYSVRKTWVVAGIHDLDAVPRSFLLSDRVQAALLAELQAAVRAGARDIPGVTIEERDDGTLRARR